MVSDLTFVSFLISLLIYFPINYITDEVPNKKLNFNKYSDFWFILY